MKDYNPGLAFQKNSPEQKIIKDARNLEYEKQFKRTSEDRLNQEHPTPIGIFKTQVQGIAREIVKKASDLTNKKKKGELDNSKYAAEMASIDQMVSRLGQFAKTGEANIQAYKTALREGTLSYGMDQNDEGVLKSLINGDVALAIDDDGKVKMEGKATNPLTGEFDVNIYDFVNVPAPVNRIRPINLSLDPFAKSLGLDANGQPITRLDEQGRPIYDTGDFSEHKQPTLEFIQDALETAGPSGVRSYLGDHMNLPNSEIKRLMENINYNDGENDWDDEGTQKVYESLNEYIGNKYQRQRKPHPDTLAAMTTNQASQIAAKKNVPLHKDTVTMGASQQPVMMAEQAVITPNQVDVAKEAVVESPFSYKSKKKVKKNKAIELIKKYSA